MQSENFKKETNVLRSITQASDAIRRKHKMMKLGRETTERTMSEVLKPVITPLEKLVDQSVTKESLNKKRKKGKTADTSILKSEDTDDDDEDNSSQYQSVDDFPFDPKTPSTSTPMKKITPIKTMTPADRIPSTKSESPVATQNLLRMYLDRYDTEHGKKDFDKEFGVRMLKHDMKIGDSVVNFHGNSMTLKGQEYTLTPGLIELIFKKSPNMTLITETDKHTYGDIIRSTNADRMFYKSGGPLRTSSTLKYKNIITNLIDTKTGRALPRHMIASKKPRKMDYVYWDDPNELVDRLRLLMASQSAGNMSHTNEIMSILEELREARIIY
ncbi:uncharacterized protein LOC107043664 [Diachasma alloeum]|uniref:uncharacterized protein LOC107043664 n=1 Tax=Diachasma alloeum TaxID=454923 RepID=UPI0007382F6F|nr:uncharacterized protein LOC107043664 [Diachasma alloeum]